MNLHHARRLSPIPRSDESDYGGAEVRDIPFYRPARKPVDKTSTNGHAQRPVGSTHDLDALVSGGLSVPQPSSFPGRSR